MNEELEKKFAERLQIGDKYITDWWDNWDEDIRDPQNKKISYDADITATVAELPPEFLFLHEAIFMDEEVVENVNPDDLPQLTQPKKWWEEDYEAKSCDDRANDLLETWKKLSGDFLDEA